MTGHPVLDIDAVSKGFGTVDILRQVSVRVEPGSVVAIVGHNGAGKTTLMRMALGLVRPDSGEVRLDGIPMARLGRLGGLVSASLDASALPASWRTRAAVRMAADLAGVADRQAREALTLVGLDDVGRRRIGNLSMGMRQRLAIAIALVATPRLLMLDEPTNALDPAISHELRGWLGEHASRGNSVLLSSHNLAEVEEVADRIIVLDRGQVVQDAAKSTMLTADSAVVRVDQPDILNLLCGTPADRRLLGRGGALDRPRRGTQRNQPLGRHAARPGTDDQRPVPVGGRPRDFRCRTAAPVCHKMSSRGEILSARPGIESSGLVPGGLRAIRNRWSATGRRRSVWRLLLPVLIGWPMAADLHYSPVRLAAAALVMAAVIARFRWPAPALLLASVCLSVAPGPAVVAVLVLAYGAAYRISSPYRACAAFAAAWVLVALSALHRVTDPATTDSLALAAMIGVSCLAPPAAVGALAGVRARRLMDLRERNEILLQANLLGESQAKMAERARIAGEMHDLIGHRLSLISLHAGALELGTRAAAPQLSEQAVLIRTTAKQALDELREVLGILNADAGGDGPDPEAGDHADTGTRADVDALVLASRRAGTPVELQWIGDDLTGLDRPVRRAVHRLVREALTNVHKHAPGMPTRVRVEHQAETVGVEIGNHLPTPPTTITIAPRTGLGLIGLQERVRLHGGTLATGPDGDRFVVRALLPIAAHTGHAPESGDPAGRHKKAPS